MEKINRRIVLLVLPFMAMPIMGQEKPDEEALPTFVKDVETTIAADVVSQYIWRGQDLGNVSLQPTLGEIGRAHV